MIALENLIQGSQEWLEARQGKFTASEAPAMMGKSKYQTRNALLQQKSTGITPEIDANTQKLFDRGHESEAGARKIAESIVGDDLFPVTATSDNGELLASYDGLTLLNNVNWEHKLYSAPLAAQIKTGEIEDHYVWQLEQQLLISGAEKTLFMCSDGTEENCAYMWYFPQEGFAERLLQGWAQFEKDLAEFVPAEVKQIPKGSAPTELMALNIQLTGTVTNSNLVEFKQNALTVFESINTDLSTDEDFASAEATVKWCKEVEDKLAAAKDHALSQTATIDDLFKTIDALSAEARSKRLELDKLVKARKQEMKIEIATAGKAAVDSHRDALNTGLGGTYLPIQATDFNGAMKGKRTIESLQGASDDLVATTKIAMSAQAETIRTNLKAIDASDFVFLFSDKPQLVLKDPEFVALTIKQRITDHKEALAEKEKAEADKKEEVVEPKSEPKAATQAYKGTPLRKQSTPFESWWHSDGSAMTPTANEDLEGFAYRVAKSAFEYAEQRNSNAA